MKRPLILVALLLRVLLLSAHDDKLTEGYWQIAGNRGLAVSNHGAFENETNLYLEKQDITDPAQAWSTWGDRYAIRSRSTGMYLSCIGDGEEGSPVCQIPSDGTQDKTHWTLRKMDVRFDVEEIIFQGLSYICCGRFGRTL